jgi:serine/threonine-protein kinase
MAQEIGSILDEKYEIVRLVGEGGMGSVYEAKHLLIGRRLAIKFLHPQYATSTEVITRFHREAQAAAKIGHENIIEVTDMGTAVDGSPYIVMEFLEGCDVKTLIENEEQIPVKRAAHIMVQSLSALHAAHQVGIIHRDIKPENIYLIEKGLNPDYVKLLDFGISKFRALETDDAKGLTQTGTVLGTPHYMSPEQARGEQDLNLRSDIYAMGVILYQMLTGKLPFDAANYNALLIKILTEEPVPPEQLNPDLPPELADAINTAMSRDPNTRFSDCLTFRARLLPFVPGASDVTSSLSTASRTAIREAMYSMPTPMEMTQSGIEGSKRKLLPAILGGAALLVIAAVLAIVFLVLPDDGPTPPDPQTDPAVASKPDPKPDPVSIDDVDNVDGVDASAEGDKPTGDQVEEPLASSVLIRISAEPSDAKIKVDGVDVGSNPFSGPFVRAEALRTVEISASGYKSKKALVKFAEDLDLSYELEKAPTGKKGGKKVAEKAGGDKEQGDKKAGGGKGKGKGGKKPNRKIDYDDPWK